MPHRRTHGRSDVPDRHGQEDAGEVIQFLRGTSRPSTAGKEARIQTGALPAVGWSVLLFGDLFFWCLNRE